jgi:sporulation protein YlmC with PRC-barrel domain
VKSSGVIYVSRLMNCDVKNRQGDTVGKLEELVLDAELGRAAYGVIKSGGGFLKSDKLFAVPCGALQLADDESGLVLDVEKDSLQNAASFDKDRWPDMSDRRWGNSVHAFFETTPYWEDNREQDARAQAQRREDGGVQDGRGREQSRSGEDTGEEPARDEERQEKPIIA